MNEEYAGLLRRWAIFRPPPNDVTRPLAADGAIRLIMEITFPAWDRSAIHFNPTASDQYFTFLLNADAGVQEGLGEDHGAQLLAAPLRVRDVTHAHGGLAKTGHTSAHTHTLTPVTGGNGRWARPNVPFLWRIGCLHQSGE